MTPTNPTLTIALPFFNSRQTIDGAIRSILAQTWTDWELLFLDDGSVDGSVDLAAAVKDPRVRLYSDGQNRGLSHRLNQSAALARGRYLARMDADDLMHPDRLRRQIEYLESHPEVDVVGASTYTMDAQGNLTGKRHWRGNVDPAVVLAHGLFLHPTAMGRIQWFRDHPYDEGYVRAEDHDLWCRALSSSRFGYIPELLFFYREGGTASPQKYACSGRGDRMIFRAYGPGIVGRWETRKLIACSLAKVGIFRLLHCFGLERWLIARRNTPLTDNEYQEGQRVLREIRSTDPGEDFRLVTVEQDDHAG